MRNSLRAGCLLLPLIWLTGCDEIDIGPSDRFQEDFHYSFALAPGGRLSVEGMNGTVDISVWEKDTVEINGSKYASNRDYLRDIRVDAQASGNSVNVRATRPSGWHGNMGARFNIRVPKRVDLERISTSNGSIRVDNVEGMARLRTSNGTIHVSGTKGEADITTSNGRIEMNHTGNARLRTSNGGINVELSGGWLEAGTSNGTIVARITKPDSNQPVRLESSNGRIELTLDSARDVRASSSNSSIEVRLPSSANARLRARTSNSSITTDFEVRVASGALQSKHSLDGTIGSGGPLIDLSTSNGHIKVVKF